MSTIVFSCLPFLATFVIVAIAVQHRIFPLLSRAPHSKLQHEALGSPTSQVTFRDPLRKRWSKLALPCVPRLAGLVFSSNIALSAVLVELLLCEISGSVNPVARGVALRVTLTLLLLLLIVVTPALEIHSVIAAGGWKFTDSAKSKIRIAWLLEGIGLALWLLGFWAVGEILLGSYLHEKSYTDKHSFSEGCLERIGVIGVSLMASLAGFAAISSLWQNFGIRTRPVSAPGSMRS